MAKALMEARNGYAADVTGGTASFTVTTLADSGAGSLRDAVSVPGRYIKFDPSIHGGTIALLTTVNGMNNTTIDGLGSGIKITGRGVVFDINNMAADVTQVNAIVQGLTFEAIDGSSTEDGLAFRGTGQGGTRQADLWWVRYCTFRGTHDGLLDITQPGVSGGAIQRGTVEYCEFGPATGPAQIAANGGSVDWDNIADPVAGKACLMSDASTGLPYGTIGASLNPPLTATELADTSRITMHHCWFHGNLQRNPLIRAMHLHIYNCLIENYGWPAQFGAPKGKGIEAQTLASVRAEACIIDQYAAGDPHEVDGTLVTHPCMDALAVNTSSVGADHCRLLNVGCVLHAGAVDMSQFGELVPVPPYLYCVHPTDPADPGGPVNDRLRDYIRAQAGAR